MINFLVVLVNNMCKNSNILLTCGCMLAYADCYNISPTLARLVFFSVSMAMTS